LAGIQPDAAPMHVSRTNASPIPPVSPLTTLAELELNATYRASGLIDGLPPPAVLPSEATLMSVVAAVQAAATPIQVSRRKTHAFLQVLVFGRMLVASESKATYLPFALIAESKLLKLTAEPLD